MTPSRIEGVCLALDPGSPRISVALVEDGELVAQRTLPQRESATGLLRACDRVLAAGGRVIGDVAGLAVLRGPGSFTGLRIGLGFALGLHQALELPVATIPTLDALALAAGPGETPVLAAVDALRGDWYAARFRVDPLPEPLDEPTLMTAAELGELAPCRAIGFGLATWLATREAGTGLETLEPPPLAPFAAALARRPGARWDASFLTRPIYARPPAATLPAR